MPDSKTVLIIDDELTVRLVLKKLITKYLPDIKIFTSEDGVQGLGTAMIIVPDLIIIDSTLPKYSGRELIEYISTNPKFTNTPIVVLNQNEDVVQNNVPLNYKQLAKQAETFPDDLISYVYRKLNPDILEDIQITKNIFFRFAGLLGKKIVHYSNEAENEYAKIQKPNLFIKIFSGFQFLLYELLIGFYLPFFYAILGRKDKEENIDQKNKDAAQYRSQLYPAIGLFIGTLIVIIFQILVIESGLITTGFFFRQPVNAAAKIWDGGGTTNNWSDCVNWDLNVCPAAGDTVTFNGTSVKNVTVDATFAGTVGSITIAAGYTGTITLARSLTITSTFSQASGTFSGAAQTMSVGTTFSLTAGTFTSSSGTMSVASTFTISGTPTFNNNSGTISFSGTTATLACNSVSFNTVNFTGQTGVKTVNSDCSLPLGASPTIPNGITLNGTLSGTGTITQTTGTTTINSTGALSGFTGLTGTTNDLTIAGPTISFTSYSPFSIGGVFILSSGTFTAPSGTMSVASTFTISGGTFTHNSGTVNFTGSTATLGCNSATFNAVNFTGQTGVKTVNSNCSLPIGSNPTIPNGISLSGTLSGTGTITNTTGLLTINTGAVLSGFTGLTGTTNSLTIAGSTIDFSAYNPAVVGTDFTLSSGAFTSPSGTLSVSGNFTLTSGTFTHNSGTINFAGSTATLSCNSTTFSAVNFTGQTGVKTVNSNCALPLGSNPTIPDGITLSGTLSGTGTITQTTGTLTLNSGSVLSGFTGLTGTTNNLTIAGATANLSSYNPLTLGSNFTMSSGTFTAPSGTMIVTGNFTVTSGTFTHSSGIVNFTGGTSTLSCGTVTFNSVNFSGQTGVKTADSSCYLPLGSNPTIPNGLTLAGTISGTGTITMTTGTMSISSGYLFTGFTGLTGTSNSLTSTASTANFGSFTTLFIGNVFTLTSGTFTAPSGTMEVQGNFTIPFAGSKTFVPNSGTLKFSGGTAILACNFSTLNAVTFTGQTAEKSVATDCSLPLGANPTIPNGINLVGGLSGSGTITQTTGTLTLNSGSNLSGFNGLTGTSNNLIVNISAGSLFLTNWSPVVIGGDFTFTSGNFSAPTGTMTVGGDFLLNGGTFTNNNGTVALTGGSSSINCSAQSLSTLTISTSGTKTFSSGCTLQNAFTLSSGTVIAPSGGALSVRGDFTLSSGTTFTHNSGAVTFAGGTAAISCNNTTFNVVSFTGQTGVKTVNSDCSLPLGASPTIPNGITLNGILSGTGTITETTGTLTLNSGSNITSFSGLTGTSNNLVIAGGTYNMSGYASTTIPGFFTMSSGTLTAPPGNLSIAGNFTITGGTFNNSSGTVVFPGNGATIACNNVTFNMVSFVGQLNTKTVNSNCNLPIGSSPTFPTGINLYGTLTGTGTITQSTGGLWLYTGAVLTGFTGFSGASTSFLNISGANMNFSAYSPFQTGSSSSLGLNSGSIILPNGADLKGGFYVASGSTATLPSGNMFIGGPLTVTAGATFNNSSGTVTFNTTTASTNFNCNGLSLYDVVIAATGSGSYIMASDCIVNSFTMTSGTWLDPSLGAGLFYTLFINGNFVENAATTFGGIHLAVQFSGSGLQTISKSAGTFSSKFYVFNTGIVQLSTAFVVTTQVCQIYGGGSYMYTNGLAFTCAGGFTILSGGTIQMQGAETVTSPTLNSGSTVIYVGNGNAGANAYTIAAWTYTNATLFINSTDGTTDSYTFNSNLTIATLTVTAGTVAKGISQTTLSATTININGSTASWAVGAITLTNSLFNCTAGTMTSGSSTINGGTWNIAGCAYTAPTGTLSLTGDFTYSSGTFTNSSGTIAFNGSGSQNITCGSAVLATVSFTVGGTKTFLSDCSVGAMNATLGTVNGSGTINIIAAGLITVNGGTWSTGFSTITANAGITCSSGTMSNGSATVDINGTLTISGCTYNATSVTTTISTNFTKTTGTFNGGTGIVTFDGAAQTVTCGSATFNTVNFTTAGAKSLSGTCTTGALNMTLGTITTAVTSPWTSNGLITINGAIFSPGANTVTGNAGITCSSGSITGGTATFRVIGSFDLSGCTFTNGGNTIAASSGINCTAGTFTGAAAALNINGSLTINGCSFTAPSVTTSISGDFTYTSGTFTHNSGTFAFDANTQEITCGSAALNTANFTTAGGTGGTVRGYNTSEISGSKIYIWGGYDGTTTYNTMDIFDIPTSSWTTGTAGGGARYAFQSSIVNGKIYYWGGYNGAYINTMSIYDIAGNSWTTGTTGGTAKGYSTSIESNGKIYYWAGIGASVVNTLSIYDIAGNSWSTGAAGGTARYGHTSALYNGKIYSWGGYTGSTYLNTVDIYDIAGNSWTTGTSGGTARYVHKSALYNGKMYFWGGANGTTLNTLDIYDIVNNTWSTGTAGGTARYEHTATLYNGNLYYTGGRNTVYINTMDVYNIATDTYNPKTIIGGCSAGIMNFTGGTVGTSGSPTITAGGLVTVNGAQFVTGPANIVANAGITCSSGSMDSGLASAVDVNGTLTISGCAFTSTASTMTISTNFTKTTGTFDGGSGIVTFDGGTQTVTCGSSTFNTVNFTTAGTKTLSGTCTTGIMNMNAGTIGMAVTSPWSFNGLYTLNGATFTPGANTIKANAGMTCTSGTFTGGTAAVSLNGVFTINGCTFSAPTVAMNIFGDYIYSSGTFTHNSSSVIFGGANQNLTATVATGFYIATFNSSFGTGGTARSIIGSVIDNGKIYNWGGYNGVTPLTAMEIFDINSNTYTSGAAGGSARYSHTATLYNGKIYYWAGYNAGYLNTMDIYDIASNTWSTGATGGTARSYSTGTLYNGKIYYWGGNNGASLNTVNIYDIANNSWSSGATGGTARYLQSAALSGGKIYYWGGTNGTSMDTVDIYDITGNSWSTGASGGTARYGHAGTLYNGKIYQFGGYNGTTFFNTLDIYDIAGNSWSTGAAGGSTRYTMGVNLYNGKIYYDHGYNGGYLNTMDIYDIATDKYNSKQINGAFQTEIMNFTAGDINASPLGLGNTLATLNGLMTVNGANLSISTGEYLSPLAGFTCSSGTVDASSSPGVHIGGAISTSNFLVSGCTFTAPSTGNFRAYDNFTITSGIFNHNNGNVYMLGSSNATLNTGCTNVNTCAATFEYLWINKGITTATVTLNTNGVRTGALLVQGGTFVQGALNVRSDATSGVAINIGNTATYSNTSTGDLFIGGTVYNGGTMNLQGTTSACPEADAISITSTSSGTQRGWGGTGTFNINDVSVQDQGGTGSGLPIIPTSIVARSSTNVSNNGSNWFFLGCTNAAPSAPTSLTQKKLDNTTTISTGDWTKESSITYGATLADADNPDGVMLCVEYKAIGVSFTNTENGCGTAVSYSGTGVLGTYSPNFISDNTYHWQARTKDLGGLYSSWVSYGGNAESATDFGKDSSAPTGGVVYDGTSAGVDATYNGGSGTSLSANWSGFNFNVSGISSYDYSIGTTAGATDILGWTTNGTATSVTATGLSLRTLLLYYFNVRANDIAGNSVTRASNGQYVTPSISFAVSSLTVTFDNLNAGNTYTNTKTTTITTSTNAFQGYEVRLYKSDLLRDILRPTNTINDFSAGSYASPAAWSSGVYGFGYTSNDTSFLSGGNKFGGSPCAGGGSPPCYAPFSSTASGDIVADNNSTVSGTPISNEQFIITYKVSVPSTQTAGTYRTNLIYSVIPHY